MMQAKQANAAQALNTVIDFQKRGRWKDCIAAAESFITTYGAHPVAYYLAGVGYEKTNNLLGAEKYYAEALKHEKSFHCMFALAKIHHARGQAQKALPLLKEALEMKPQAADALALMGAIHLEQERHAEAEKALLAADQITPSAETSFNLGILCLRTGKPEDAIKLFSRAVEMNPANPQNWEYLAQTYFLLGQYVHAILIFHKMAKENPQELRYRHLLTAVMREFTPVKFEPVFKEAMLFCLAEEKLSLDNLNSAFASLITKDPAHTLLQKSHGLKTYADFKTLAQETSLKELDEPLFLKGMESFIVRDADLERVFTYLRRYALEQVASGAAGAKNVMAVCGAIAAQCFLNEYIYEETPEETALVKKLEEHLTASSKWDEQSALQALIIAAYKPLAALAGTVPLLSEANVAKAGKFPVLQAVLDSQVSDFRREQKFKETIPSLNMSADETSRQVRAMYEENPYPRWRHVFSNPNSLSPSVDLEALRKNTADGRLEILNAGCGTGQHVVLSAANYPNANILAIDLSRASLAFAKKRCDEYGLDNITFMQGDILELGAIGRKFDIIESAGVLHHMKDPMKGWQVLTDLLKPGGYMRIGLYSELARQDVVASRDFIARHGYPATLEGIRACRKAIMELFELDPVRQIIRSPDFYSTSLCRDLIFHVQEHRFTIPQIRACLDTLGLTFVCFNIVNSRTLHKYVTEHPDDKKLSNLNYWEKFEEENPRTFRNMYQFWCRKPA